jgi:hypothetical protein
MPQKADVLVENHGSIFLFQPLTPVAEEWLEENLEGEVTYLQGALVVEPRYAGDLAEGMTADGLALQ